MNLPRIVHVHDNVEGAVYIGRANGRKGLRDTPFGNPFKITPETDRFDVVRKYRDWLFEHDDGRMAMWRLHELRAAPAIACWCRRDHAIPSHDNLCHGDVLRFLLAKYTDVQLQDIVTGRLYVRPHERPTMEEIAEFQIRAGSS